MDAKARPGDAPARPAAKASDKATLSRAGEGLPGLTRQRGSEAARRAAERLRRQADPTTVNASNAAYANAALGGKHAVFDRPPRPAVRGARISKAVLGI